MVRAITKKHKILVIFLFFFIVNNVFAYPTDTVINNWTRLPQWVYPDFESQEDVPTGTISLDNVHKFLRINPTGDGITVDTAITHLLGCTGFRCGDLTIDTGQTLIGTVGTIRIPNSNTLPLTCTVGDEYMDTDATSGQRFYLCESANNWVLQGGGGGSSHDPLSLAGTPDYLTLAGQILTLTKLDMADDLNTFASSVLYTNLTDETGSGAGALAVFNISPQFETSILGNYLTASEILITDASKNLVSAPVVTYPSLAELAFVKGVSSAIQDQITDNAALVDSAAKLLAIMDNTALDFGTGVLTAAGFTLAANENLTLGGETVDHDGTDFVFSDSIKTTNINITGLTASEIVLTDASKNLVSAAVATYPSPAELAYVKDVTSAIQTQLNAEKHQICFFIDGAGSAVGTGEKAWVRATNSFTIGGAEITADQSGSCVVDIWKDTYANYPPANADSICDSGTCPTLSTAIKAQDTTLTSWTTDVTAGDYLMANVDSCSTAEKVEVCIYE